MATEHALLTLDTLLLPLIVDALLVRRGGAATARGAAGTALGGGARRARGGELCVASGTISGILNTRRGRGRSAKLTICSERLRKKCVYVNTCPYFKMSYTNSREKA